MSSYEADTGRHRATVVRSCVLALIGVGALTAVRAFTEGHASVAASIGAAAFFGAAILFRLERGGAPEEAAGAGIAVLYLLIVFSNTTTGGFHDTNFAWFPVVPITAALLLGTRAAMVWGAVVVLTTYAFWYLAQNGFEFAHRIPEPDRAGRDLFNRVAQTSGLVVLASAFARGHQRVSQALTRSHQALQQESMRVQLLQVGAVAGNEAETVVDAVASFARRLASATDWPLIIAWSPDENDRWHFDSHWVAEETDRFEVLLDQTRVRSFAIGELDLGRVARLAHPRSSARTQLTADGSGRGNAAVAAGLGSVVAIPIVAQDRTLALLECWRESPEPVDAETLNVLAEAGRQIGRVAHRIQLEERIRRAQRLESVAQLAAGIAHEINNPMTYVRSNLTALAHEVNQLREAFEKPEFREDSETRFAECDELVRDALEGADRTIAIVRDIRAYSHGGSEVAEAAEVAELAEAALRLCRPHLNASIRVVRSFAPSAVVRGNPSQLQQVFVNLIVNGAQSMPDGGQLHVATHRVGEDVLVSVEDEGAGIPPVLRERVFDPFFTTKTVGEGTGLGLYVSHGIVAAHRGEIRVEVVEPRGTRFVVRLPAA